MLILGDSSSLYSTYFDFHLAIERTPLVVALVTSILFGADHVIFYQHDQFFLSPVLLKNGLDT